MEIIAAFIGYWLGIWYQLLDRSVSAIVLTLWILAFIEVPRYVIPDILFFIRSFIKKERNVSPSLKKALPLVSVIIPAHNEEDAIKTTVESLLNNDYPRLDIIAVDDGSTDNTYAVCKKLAADGSIRAFRSKERSGKASCLNLALAVAKGDFIVQIDADTSFDHNAISYILEPFFDDSRIGAVGGNIKVRNKNKNILTRLQACEYLNNISLARREMGIVNMLMIISGAFGCYRRECLEAIGGWDPGVADDLDVCMKLRRLGWKLGFAHKAVAMTEVPETVKGVIKQRRLWDKGFIRAFYRKHFGLFNPFRHHISNFLAMLDDLCFHIIPYAAFAIGPLLYFLIYPIETMKNDLYIFPIIFLSLIGIYTISSAISLSIAIFLSERRREEWRLLGYSFLLPFYRGFFLRFLQIKNYFFEFLQILYKEPFYPEKVWREAPKW